MPEYRLIEQLGEGGMGVIWKALQLPDRREVAVKFLRDEIAQDRDLVKRFRLEVEACIKLTHPNIIRIFDAGSIDNKPYFAMELLHEAEPLDYVLRTEKPFPIARAATIMIQLLDALEYCHARNIIHRDLKPANMMVDPDDHLTLMDFGLVKDHNANTTALTAAGATVGSPRYMAPEVCRGGAADLASDIWAAGVIFYEMLWGQTPFLGDSLQQTVVAILRETPYPLLELRPEVGDALDPVLARFLDKNPETRLSSARRARMLVRSWFQQWQDAQAPGGPRVAISNPGLSAGGAGTEAADGAQDDAAEQPQDTPRPTSRRTRVLATRLVAALPPPPPPPKWHLPVAAGAALLAVGAAAYQLVPQEGVTPPPSASALPARPSPLRASHPSASANSPAPSASSPSLLVGRLLDALNALAPRALAGKLAAEVRATRAQIKPGEDSERALVPLRLRWEKSLAGALARDKLSQQAAALAPLLAGFYDDASGASGPDERAALHAALTDLRDLEDLASSVGVAMEEPAHALVAPSYAPAPAALKVPVMLVLGLAEAPPRFTGELANTAATGVLDESVPEELADNLENASRARTATATAPITLGTAGVAVYQHPRPITIPARAGSVARLAPRNAEVSVSLEATKLECGIRIAIAVDRQGKPGPWITLATLHPAQDKRHVVTHAIPPGLVRAEPLHVRVELVPGLALVAAGAPQQTARVFWVAIARDGSADQ